MAYSKLFTDWVNTVFTFEGCYANDPNDKGGETYMGCCRKYYPNLKVWESLDKFRYPKDKRKYVPNEEELREIVAVYYNRYWKAVNADAFKNKELALCIADCAVNCGVSASVKMLQRIIGVKVDGICGEQTVATANIKKQLLRRYVEARIEYYYGIVAKDESQRKFLKGWLRRCESFLEKDKE